VALRVFVVEDGVDGMVPIHWGKRTGAREVVVELGREWGWGGYAVVLESKVEDLRKDSEETWA
jgi:hypothetical protein